MDAAILQRIARLTPAVRYPISFIALRYGLLELQFMRAFFAGSLRCDTAAT